MNSIVAIPILEVRNLGKDYDIYSSHWGRFAHLLFGRLSPTQPRVFPAVRDVSFELQRGEAVAVLGRNGAGKSTLLQIISGLLTPTRGSVTLPKRVVGLLELGSGFNPDFTGRENIRINGAILGLDRRELEDKIDGIIAFAEINEFIDHPVRSYSSGMFLRLAFAIAIAADPEVLLVDEVLAVGDIFFRQKCYDRLEQLRAGGTAIVLVTHSLSDAAEFCDRGLVLSEGKAVFYGNGKAAVEYYIHHERDARTGTRSERLSPEATDARIERDGGSDQKAMLWLGHSHVVDLRDFPQVGSASAAVIEKMLISSRDGEPGRVFEQGSWIRIRAAFLVKEPIERAILGIGIRNDKNILVHGKNGINLETSISPKLVGIGTCLYLTYDLKLDVALGEYTIELAIASVPERIFIRKARMTPDELSNYVHNLRIINGAGAFSVVSASRDETASFSHYGIADLPHSMAIDCMQEYSEVPTAPAEEGKC